MTPDHNKSNNKIERPLAPGRLAGLLEVTSIISSTLSLDEVMTRVLETAQRIMDAEASCVMLLRDNDILEFAVALGEVGEQVKKNLQLRVGEGIGGWVAQTGKPTRVEDAYKDPRFQSHHDETTGFLTKSVMAVPLKIKEKLIGVAEVFNKQGPDAFTADDEELFTAFAAHAAIAIENARMHAAAVEHERLAKELELAREVQQSFLPQTIPQPAGFHLSAKMVPARQVGGDFYDFVACPDNGVGLLIGDVSGKGVPAALYMARLISDFRSTAMKTTEPSEILTDLNRVLVARSTAGMFATVQYALLNPATGSLSIASAGHPSPLIKRNGHAALELVELPGGPPLGLSDKIAYETQELSVARGDRMVLYSDGLIEAAGQTGATLITDGLHECFNDVDSECHDCAAEIIRRIGEFGAANARKDDVTVISLHQRQ